MIELPDTEIYIDAEDVIEYWCSETVKRGPAISITYQAFDILESERKLVEPRWRKYQDVLKRISRGEAFSVAQEFGA